MIHFEHNAVDNADAILEELGNINYLYSYYHSDKFFDLAHKDQNLYLKCVKDHVNGKFAYHFMKLTVHDNIDTLPTHTKALCKHKDCKGEGGRRLTARKLRNGGQNRRRGRSNLSSSRSCRTQPG